MRPTCHRCHGELPVYDPGAPEPASGYDARAVLFCPHCSAPQLILQEHMIHVAADAGAGTGASTGAVPPPHPGALDWPLAVKIALAVAGVAVALKVLAWVLPAAGYFANLWVAGAAVLVVSLYAGQRAGGLGAGRPARLMDAGKGARIGLATGLIVTAALGVAFAVTGVLARFALHRMGGFDAEMAQQFTLLHAQLAEALQQQNGGAAKQAELAAMLAAPETRAGYALFALGMEAAIVLLLSLGGGAFAGMLRAPRRAQTSARG